MTNESEVKPKGWFARHRILTGMMSLALLFLIVIMLMAGSGSKPSTEATPTADPNTPKQLSEVGAEGYLRLPNNSDATQNIILTENKEDYEKVTKAMLANDTQGLLEIPSAFGVSVGTKVKLLESGIGVRRVRILEVPEAIDQDKVGRAGWVAKEWVVNR